MTRYAQLASKVTPVQQDALDAVVFAVDACIKRYEVKWGLGRLATIVPVETAARYQRQCAKFSRAIVEGDVASARRHGEAMERGLFLLDEIAEAMQLPHGNPEQWEFETPDGLVILVREARRTSQARLHGREAQVWSLDEIASVIRAHPMLAKVKQGFPEAVMVEPVKSGGDVSEDALPF